MGSLTVNILPPPVIKAKIGVPGTVAAIVHPSLRMHASVSAAVPAMTTASGIVSETPTGITDGTNATFTTTRPFHTDSFAVWINGVLLHSPGDYLTVGTSTILFTESPHVGDVILARFTPL
jgi:hypothetical protein